MKASSVLFIALIIMSVLCFPARGQDQIDRLIVSSLTTNTRPGASVDLKGDYAILGGPGEVGQQWDQPGEAYIFWRDGSTWVKQAQIQASDAGILDRFGSDVAIWDPYAVVVASQSNAVYVFHREGTNWTETQKIMPTGGCASVDIDMSNEVMVVGSPDESSVVIVSGAAYIYDLVPLSTTWVQTARVKGAYPQSSSYFGDAVSIQGTNVLVGAWGYDTNFYETGVAFLFAYTAGSVWTQEYMFAVTDGVDTVYYGRFCRKTPSFLSAGDYSQARAR